MDFVSLGMLTLDHLIFPDAEQHDLLGGAATFAVLGARLVAGPDRSNRIGWVVHEGNDFPSHVKAEIDSWNLRTKYIATRERQTTRARNKYEGDERVFNFETPKMHVMPDMLDDDQLNARSFHIIGTPARCVSLVEAVLELRQSRLGILPSDEGGQRPIFVWEPMEHSCAPDQMACFKHAMRLVDVFSPNELEFARLIGFDLQDDESIPSHILRQHSLQFLEHCKLQAVVVRLGGHGNYVASMDPEMHDVRMPAFYDASRGASTEAVVDVTGAGNAFLGAYCFCLSSKRYVSDLKVPFELNSHEMAAVTGSAAASVVVEQFGMPKLVATSKNLEESWGTTGLPMSTRIRDLCPKVQKLETFRLTSENADPQEYTIE